jgi:cobalt-zinc-cadmium efflux system outer membrane protein
MIQIKQWKAILFRATIVVVLQALPLPALAVTSDVTLEQAVAEFYRNNYDILINKFEIDKAQADFVGAKRLPNPTVTFNYIGSDIRSFPPQSTDNTQLTLRLDQLFELGGKRELRSAAAQETLEAVRLSHKDTIRTLLIGFYTLFYTLKLDQLNLDLAGEELQRFDRTLTIAEKRFTAGHLSLVDYTKLRLTRLDLENALTNQETQLKNDRAQFDMLLGSVTPQAPLVELRETPQEDLVATAQQHRYDLLSLQKQVTAAAKNVALAKAGRIPDITIGVEYDSYNPSHTPTMGAGISFPIPLFNQNQGEIARRHAEQSQIETQIARAKRQIVLEIRQALNNCAASAAIFASYKSRKKEMDELLQRSEQAFTLGGITVNSHPAVPVTPCCRLRQEHSGRPAGTQTADPDRCGCGGKGPRHH